MINKVPDNSSAQRLSKLLSRNLGTNIGVSEDVTPSTNATKISEKTVTNTLQTPHSTIKHQQLSDKSGIIPSTPYFKGQLNINQRAQKRKRLDEARKQSNIESIMSLAMEYCSESASADEIDPDWFHQFVQLSEDTSSKLMQALWGKILAGEIAHPGTFSFKSLTILKQMTNKEAIAFQQACQLAMTNRKDNSNQIIYGYYQKPGLLDFFTLGKKAHINLAKLNLNYPSLLTLMDIELVYHTEIESGILNRGEDIEFNYLGQKSRFIAKKNGTVLNYFKFTQTGYELAKLLRLTPLPAYLNELDEVFSKAFTVER